MSNNSVQVKSDSKLFLILFGLFLLLKLTGIVHWSWWVVTAPLWIMPVLFGAMVFFMFLVAITVAVLKK